MGNFNINKIPSEYKSIDGILKEIISSYNHGNYRSAIVMLYIAVNYNLYCKLKNLSEFYNSNESKIAKKVLSIINSKSRTDETRETTLLNSCKNKKLDLLDNEAQAMLSSLKRYRNCCVHPEFNDDPEEAVAQIQKSTVQSLINTAINHIFSFKARSGDKVFSGMAKDLINHKTDFNNFDTLKHYLDSHYLNDADYKDIRYIFQELFRRIFLYSKKVSYDNKLLYYRCLLIILSEFRRTCLDMLNEYLFNTYESNVKIHDNLVINLIEQLFIDYPRLYKGNEHSIIPQDVKKDSRFKVINSDFRNFKYKGNPIKYIANYYIYSSNLVNHISSILNNKYLSYVLCHAIYNQYEDNHSTLRLQEHLLEVINYKLMTQHAEKYFAKLISSLYTKSWSFAVAEYYFENYIQYYLYDFNKNQLESLMENILNNDQCYNRNNAYNDHKRIVNQYYKIGGTDKNLVNKLLYVSNKTQF